MNESEEALESLLTSSKIIYQKIPEEGLPTPDYEVVIGNKKTFWEVKELKENAHEKKILSKIESDELGIYSVDSKRIENSIKKACSQFKGYQVINSPCVVILYDSRNFAVMDFLFTNQLMAVLFGTSVFMENTSGELFEAKRNNGLLTNRRKYISVVGIINYGKVGISFYHNPYTDHPITPNFLSTLGEQFKSIETPQGLGWKKVR